MRRSKRTIIENLYTGGLFVILFLYFLIFNRYHILYLEQNQLFRFNMAFIGNFFNAPGGLPLLTGGFFTQFFISPWAGALIITLNLLAVYLLLRYIFMKYDLQNSILSLIPVLLLTLLQSSELFTFDQSLGFLTALLFFALYISVNKTAGRYILFSTGWPVFYILAGGFSIPVVLLCVLHELLFRKEKNRYIISIQYILICILIPLITKQVIFYIQPNKIFIYPVVTELHSWFIYALILLFTWIPLILIISYLLNKSKSIRNRLLSWDLVNILAGTVIVLLLGFAVYKLAYNKKADMMLGIDHHVQQAEWDKVLKLSDKYPGFNTLVIYYTNLALYKTGHLFDKMFSYPQIGSKGLRLEWARNLNLFFGGEVFYQLSYNNESIHWAFEALVAKGLNPRSLKRLAIGCMVNGNNDIAEKYLGILKQTLFYRKWARRYQTYISDPALAQHDPELRRHIDLRVHSNFFSQVNGLNLEDLLNNHPENKMAYEYLVASLLLDKNLDGFAQVILSLKNYGYNSLPLHIEEALIFYNFYEGQNVIPEGFSFRPETIKRFDAYATEYIKLRGDRAAAAYELKKKYGDTYWYYLQFIDN
ncbi:MAG: hypothetical protein JXN62_10550 [Bacteroidales bacterium]|nr:hypothetical protein [Bacteroidales bacterium]